MGTHGDDGQYQIEVPVGGVGADEVIVGVVGIIHHTFHGGVENINFPCHHFFILPDKGFKVGGDDWELLSKDVNFVLGKQASRCE